MSSANFFQAIGWLPWLISACNTELTHEAGDATEPASEFVPSSSDAEALAFELDVLATRECPPAPHTTLDADEYVLGVKLKITAKTEQVPQNYYYGSLTDGEGQVYRAGFAGCEPRLSGTPLHLGESAAGFVNFRVPRKASNLTLEYAPRIRDWEKTRGPKISRKLDR